jgi:hypothetical protein
LKALLMAGVILSTFSNSAIASALKSDPWTMENLERVSKGSFKAVVEVSPLGFSEVRFEGSLPASCEVGSGIEKEVKGQVAIYLHSYC